MSNRPLPFEFVTKDTDFGTVVLFVHDGDTWPGNATETRLVDYILELEKDIKTLEKENAKLTTRLGEIFSYPGQIEELYQRWMEEDIDG